MAVVGSMGVLGIATGWVARLGARGDTGHRGQLCTTPGHAKFATRHRKLLGARRAQIRNQTLVCLPDRPPNLVKAGLTG